MHHGQLSHPGINCTISGVATQWYWPGMSKQITQFVKLCANCSLNKNRKGKKYGLLQSLSTPMKPWQYLSLDFLKPIKDEQAGGKQLMVVVDRFSKMVELIVCRHDVDAKDCAKLFLENVVKQHGVPDDLVSDCDSIFLSAFWKELQALMGVTLSFSTAYHPQSDGQTERVNQEVLTVLRQILFDRGGLWSSHMWLVQMAINSTVNTSHGTTPYYAAFGYHVKVPGFLSLPSMEVPQYAQLSESVRDLVTHRQTIWKQIHSSIERVKRRTEEQMNRGRVEQHFTVGDLVMLSTRNLAVRRERGKMAPRFLGPFKVLEKVGEVAYRLEIPVELVGRIHDVFHVSLLCKAASGVPGVSPQSSAEQVEQWMEEQPVQSSAQVSSQPVVEYVVQEREGRRGVELLVKFKGQPSANNRWISEQQVQEDTAAWSAWLDRKSRMGSMRSGQDRGEG